MPADAYRPEPRRADARQNRERLIDAARAAFAEARDRSVSLEAIARSAGVGIGTLYRHFPDREALVEAVYRDQVEDLRSGAASLLASRPPLEALRAWMDLFADWADAKRGMVTALAAARAGGALDLDATRRDMAAIIDTLLAAGVERGDVRPEVSGADLRALLAGILAAAETREQAARLFDLALDGVTTG